MKLGRWAGVLGGALLTLSCNAMAQTQDAAKEAPALSQVFHNSSSVYQNHSVSIAQRFTFDHFDPRHLIGHNNLYEFNTPGFNWGNSGGWSVQIGQSDTGKFDTRGIGQMHVSSSVKHATGDFAAQYVYAFTDGGATAQSDEGFALDTRMGGETNTWFHGTAAEGATPGTTLLPVTYVAGPQSQQATTDGAFMLDLSKGKISGTVTGEETLVKGTSVHIIPVSATLPVSTGIGIVDTPIPRVKAEDTPEPITLTNVHLIHGSFVAGKACLAGGWYPEQVLITKAGEAAKGVQDVTIVHKNPNGSDPNNPTSLWQGGVCGQYLSLDRNVARDGFPTSYEVVGATDASHLAYIWNVKGSTRVNVIRVYEPAAKLRNLSRKNGVVTASFSDANESYILNHAATVVIAGASDPSFNGTVHLPSYDDDLNHKLHWSQSGPDGTSPLATIDLPPSYYGFHLYPGAEVLGPQVAGGVPLEPNSVDWAPGDVIENPHNPSFDMGARMTTVDQYTLSSGANSGGQLWNFRGTGISANYFPSIWRNVNPCSLYIGCGGSLQPIQWSVYEGAYRDLIFARAAPLNEGSLITVGCDLRGCDHQAPYRILQLQNGGMEYDPAAGNFTVPQMSANLFTGHMDGLLTTTQIDLQDPRSPGQVLTITNSHGQVVINAHSSAGARATQNSSAVFAGKLAGEENTAASRTPATVLPGAADRGASATCAKEYTCTADRGRITLAASTAASVGTIASIRTSLPAGAICTATQNGGAAFLGIGSGSEGTQGFDITAGVVWHGTITIDYSCR